MSYKLFTIAIVIAIVLEFIFVLVLPSPGIRALGTFNNPNQLGYFSLLYLSLFYTVIKKNKISSLLFWIITICAFFIALFSVSKAVIMSILILICFEILYKFDIRKVKNYLFGTIIVAIGLILVGNSTLDYFQETELYWDLKQRFLETGEDPDDNFAGRGYDRIVNHPEYLLLGAGEIDVKRFNSIDLEIHSTFGNILFSYGLIGILIFLGLLTLILKKNNAALYYPLIPLILYSLTHNGIRNPSFWVFLALLYSSKKLNENNGIKNPVN